MTNQDRKNVLDKEEHAPSPKMMRKMKEYAMRMHKKHPTEYAEQIAKRVAKHFNVTIKNERTSIKDSEGRTVGYIEVQPDFEGSSSGG